MKPGTKRVYVLYTYDDVWEEMKKKLNFTDEQLREQVEKALQMNAWADIMEGMESYVDFERNPKYKEERDRIDRMVRDG